MGKSGKTKGVRSGKSRKLAFSGNVMIVMALKLLVILILLFLSRFLFYLFNLSFFSSVSFLEFLRIFGAGLRFDISAILLLNIPFIVMNSLPFRFRYKRVYQRFANAYFYIINFFVLLTNFIDIVYFRFTLKRMTADIFGYVGGISDFSSLIPQFISDFWFVEVICILFIILMIVVCRRFKVREEKNPIKPFLYYLLNTCLFLMIGFVTVIGARGGIQLRPIGLVTAGKYTVSRHVPLALNTPFSIVKTWFHPSLEMKDYYSSETELAKIYSPLHKGAKGEFKSYNVLIVIMESLSCEHIGLLNSHYERGRYRGFTPVLDTLIPQGLLFKAFANEKSSIMAIPAILSGIPSLMNDAFIQSSYSGDRISSIAGLLKEKGYTTAFFHGGTNGTMGLDNYTRLAGFDRYYGRTEYNNEEDYDGKWGIRDEGFFQFTAQQINRIRQPFVAALFSLSSHHPYFVPGKYKHVFREGNLPIQKSLMYADYSLGQFIKSARQMPWYQNTIIVITADHTSEGYFPYYRSGVGQYSIPILFLFPEEGMKGIRQEIVQQTDLMPTLLTYLGYDQDFIAFGTDMLNANDPHFSVHYVAGIYTLIKGDHVLEFDGSTSLTLFNLKQDSLQQKNLLGSQPEVTQRMEEFIKAYIQQYNNRVINNQLTVQE